MLNFQIRGYRSKINIGSVSFTEKNLLIKEIKEKKVSLVDLMILEKDNRFSDIYNINLPIVNEESELIATAYNENNYYDDGFSFFRSRLNTLIDTAPKINFGIPEKDFIIVNYLIFYGCSFEAEIENLNYDTFNKDLLTIETISIPIVEQKFVKKIIYNKSPQIDLGRSKNQLVKIKSVLYKIHSIDKSFINNSDEYSPFEILIYSEKDMKVDNN